MDLPNPEPLVERLDDGSIRVTVAGRTSTVSSEHLVPGRIAELMRAAACGS